MIRLEFRDGVCTSSESLHFEAKSAKNGIPRSMWETYSAFANTDGGVIVLGLTESEKGLVPEGVSEPHKKVESIWSSLSNNEKVSANILEGDDISMQSVDGRDLIIIEVPRAMRWDRPVFIDGNMRNTFRRRGERDYKCDIPQIRSMVIDSSERITDNGIVDSLEVKDLMTDTLKSFRNALNNLRPGNEWVDLDDYELLRRTGAARIDGETMRPTVAGLLMFGEEYQISLELGNYKVDYREYDDDETVEWSFRLVSDSMGWSGNLYDFYRTVIGRIRSRTPRKMFVGEDLKRVDDTDTDKAIREAVLNSIIHADYHGIGGIDIESRPASIIVSNPGDFRIPLKLAEEGGLSDPRNATLAKMFSLAGDVERAGRGVRLIFGYSRAPGVPSPEIEELFDPPRVRVKLFLRTVQKDSGEIENEILNIISEEPSVSISSLSGKLGTGRAKIEYTINKLKDEGILKREGGTRGRWVIIGKDQ